MKDAPVTIAAPDTAELTLAMGPIERNVAALQIIDEDSHRKGLELGKRLRGMKDMVIEMFSDPKQKAHALHKSLTTNEKKWLTPIENTASLLNSKLAAYEQKERARAEAEARERQREADRIEQERTLQEAVAADQAGDHELAEAVLDAPMAPAVVVPAPRLAEVSGTSQRVTYRGEGMNLFATVRYIAEHPEFLDCVMYNQTRLNEHARAMKDNLRIPGVRAIPNTSRSFKAE